MLGTGIYYRSLYREFGCFCETAEEFPVSYEMDGVPVSVIKAGASQEQLKKAGKECAFEGCDKITAEVLADEMYDLLPQIPELVIDEHKE